MTPSSFPGSAASNPTRAIPLPSRANATRPAHPARAWSDRVDALLPSRRVRVTNPLSEPALSASERFDALSPYLPRLVHEWLAVESGRLWREVDATVVFVDVSGFTRLSERLARLGRIGAEQLTEVIGSCFAHLLEVAYAEGGGLLKFGGDALLILFTGSEHAERACRAAVGMRSRFAKSAGSRPREDVSGSECQWACTAGSSCSAS